ncbi:MAG: O-linked N-acetylglucosamine transferase, SPINDLY family protein, partial [Cyanobacteria bacterium P01_H01_bin.150]
MKANKQITNHKSQIDKYLILGDYDKAAILYEKQISLEPNVVSHYWHLGLIRLLQGQEIEAQMTWMIPLAEIETEHIDNLTAELTAILQIEAERRKDIKDYQTAWLIRQHIREINPEDLNNLLNIIQLSSHIDIYKDEELPLYKVSTVIKTKKNINCECDLLLETISQVLDVYPLLTSTYDFIEACIKNTNNLSQIINIISNKAGLFLNNLADERLKKLTENFLKAANQNIEILV